MHYFKITTGIKISGFDHLLDLILRDIKSWVSFHKQDIFVLDLLYWLNSVAILVVDEVESPWFLENFAAKNQKVDILTVVEVFWIDLYDFCEDWAVLWATLGKKY